MFTGVSGPASTPVISVHIGTHVLFPYFSNRPSTSEPAYPRFTFSIGETTP